MKIHKRFITNLNNFKKGRREAILNVVLHSYGGKGRSLYNWFQNNDRRVSAHYAVFLDGTVEQYVRESDTAHHAGYEYNKKSIGIETQDNGDPEGVHRTEEQLNSVAELIEGIHQRYGVHLNADRIRLHREILPTKCPGNLPRTDIINRVKTIIKKKQMAENSELNQLKDKIQEQKKEYEAKIDELLENRATEVQELEEELNRATTQLERKKLEIEALEEEKEEAVEYPRVSEELKQVADKASASLAKKIFTWIKDKWNVLPKEIRVMLYIGAAYGLVLLSKYFSEDLNTQDLIDFGLPAAAANIGLVLLQRLGQFSKSLSRLFKEEATELY